MAGRARLRRLRRVRDPRSRSLRGLRSLRRARAPAPWLVPYGVRRKNPARESRDADPAGSCMARHARAMAARWRWLSTLIPRTNPANLAPGADGDFAFSPRAALHMGHPGCPPCGPLICRRGELCECLLEIDRERNLVIQRSRLLPRAGDHRQMEISRNRRLAVGHVAETGDAVLLA